MLKHLFGFSNSAIIV